MRRILKLLIIFLFISTNVVFINAVYANTLYSVSELPPSGGTGSGSLEDPYTIATPEQLSAIRGGVSGYEDWGLDKNYKLVADIDLSGYSNGTGWEPIGSEENPFTGSLDGDGFSVKNLKINEPDKVDVGLFGYISGEAFIKNLDIQDANVVASDNAGLLVGYFKGDGLLIGIENCSVTGVINANYYVGGLAGVIDETIVLKCSSSATIAGSNNVGGLIGSAKNSYINNSDSHSNTSGNGYVGGMIGWPENSHVRNSDAHGNTSGTYYIGGLFGSSNGSIIEECYASGNAVASAMGVGGLAGAIYDTRISNSYALGNVAGYYDVGGLIGSVGDGFISNCYATGIVDSNDPYSNQFGGLLGSSVQEPLNSYYSIDNPGDKGVGKGSPRHAIEMKEQANFEGWDFTNIWNLSEFVNNGYPYLRNSNLEYIEQTGWSASGIPGTHSEPYHIATPEQLYAIRGGVAGYESWGLNNDYELVADIDLTSYTSGSGWNPIGEQWTPFIGSFDGNNFTIRNLTINSPNQDSVGLFGAIYGKSLIQDLHVENVNIVGNNYVGGIVGNFYNYGDLVGKIENCSVTGAINGYSLVGGIVGYGGKVEIRNSSTDLNNISGYIDIGGIDLFSIKRTLQS